MDTLPTFMKCSWASDDGCSIENWAVIALSGILYKTQVSG